MGKQDDEPLTILSSSASIQKSLEAIRNGDAGLNDRRKAILARTPYSNDWAAFEHESITIKDLAYLSAATHPDFDSIKPSADDRDFLKYIEQSKSIIISYITGYTMEFTNNIFDDFTKGSD